MFIEDNLSLGGDYKSSRNIKKFAGEERWTDKISVAPGGYYDIISRFKNTHRARAVRAVPFIAKVPSLLNTMEV